MITQSTQFFKRPIVLAVFVTLVIIVSALCGTMSHIPQFWRLSRGNAVITGSIASLQCEKHREFIYEFRVNGNRYAGTGIAADECDQLKVGDPVRIFFDAAMPNLNSNAEPRTKLANGLILTALAGLLIPLAVILAWYRREKRVAKLPLM